MLRLPLKGVLAVYVAFAISLSLNQSQSAKRKQSTRALNSPSLDALSAPPVSFGRSVCQIHVTLKMIGDLRSQTRIDTSERSQANRARSTQNKQDKHKRNGSKANTMLCLCQHRISTITQNDTCGIRQLSKCPCFLNALAMEKTAGPANVENVLKEAKLARWARNPKSAGSALRSVICLFARHYAWNQKSRERAGDLRPQLSFILVACALMQHGHFGRLAKASAC